MPSSLLETDGYKFSMAEAGWPLRRETFYYSHRLGGPQLLPLDVASFIRTLLPVPGSDDYAFLVRSGYEMGAGFKAAILQSGALRIHALPKGAIFYGGEPVFSVSGPSALVSWLEPLILQLHFRIQVATLATQRPEELARAVATVTCEAERQLVLETLDAVGVRAPAIRVDSEGYVARVRKVASELVAAVGGDGARIFEVGLRAASCIPQHRLALEGCKAAGVTRTSNVEGARALGMIPIGTMGHEHIQRYGTDAAAFRAMRDRRPERSSYLLDTFDTLTRGLPAAYDLIAEEPGRGDSIRFDSGDKVAQFRAAAAEARRRGIDPVYILEDGLDVEATRVLEGVRAELGLATNRVFYGYGGYLVARPSSSGLTRDRVSAVWKLAQTAVWPTMKFGNTAAEGKQSLPGRPVVWRRVQGEGPIGIVGQEGEAVPNGYAPLTGAATDVAPLDPAGKVERSPATRALMAELRTRAFGSP